jgi:hypothetical protein
LAHQSAGKSQRATAQPQVRSPYVEKADPDREAHDQDHQEQPADQKNSPHHQSADAQGSPAAIVSISSAARANVAHPQTAVIRKPA